MAWPKNEFATPVSQNNSGSPGTLVDFSSLQTAQSSPNPPTNVKKRKASESQHTSPQESSSTRAPVKRACNQCRQQKLKCDVKTEPEFASCSRCQKHHLHCTIDPNFKRTEKRLKNQETERELERLQDENSRLKQQLAQAASGFAAPASLNGAVGGTGASGNAAGHGTGHGAGAGAAPYPPTQPYGPANGPGNGPGNGSNSHFPGPNEAAASRSLLDLAQSYDGHQYVGHPRSATNGPTMNILGPITLADDQIRELYRSFFKNYHLYLPILPGIDNAPWGYVYKLHPLLHWAIIAVASRHYQGRDGLLMDLKEPFEEFMWFTLQKVPQTYHVVKALCLVCSWPFPTTATSTDPSMMLCGMMIQIAMQFGLHRPSHAQDFSRDKINLNENEIRDRMNTWVSCNLVAQNISTGYGMPQISRWNWFTHGLHLDRISPALSNRCTIERFIERITRALYTMQRDPVLGESDSVDNVQRAMTIDTFARDYEEMKTAIIANSATPVDLVYLHIASLHLRLTVLFDSPKTQGYRTGLKDLYVAASTFLKAFLALPADGEKADPDTGRPSRIFATNYIGQLVLAAGFTLLKLLNSTFAVSIDIVDGRTLFQRTVSALRTMSVVQNDLSQRLAEVLAQLWQASGKGEPRLFSGDDGMSPDNDQSLQLKVRCRMSMSLLFDSVWRWKEQVGSANASKNLDRAVQQPTMPVAVSTSSVPVSGAMETTIDPSLSTGITWGADGDVGVGGLDFGLGTDSYTAPFEAFSWALDGFLDMGPEGFSGFQG